MKVKEYFHNVQCDCCKELASDTWWVDDEQAHEVADENDFLNLGGKDYCPRCRYIDDGDNICTKDGRRFDSETYEELEPLNLEP